jgi:hypothetical protein
MNKATIPINILSYTRSGVWAFLAKRGGYMQETKKWHQTQLNLNSTSSGNLMKK